MPRRSTRPVVDRGRLGEPLAATLCGFCGADTCFDLCPRSQVVLCSLANAREILFRLLQDLLKTLFAESTGRCMRLSRLRHVIADLTHENEVDPNFRTSS